MQPVVKAAQGIGQAEIFYLEGQEFERLGVDQPDFAIGAQQIFFIFTSPWHRLKPAKGLMTVFFRSNHATRLRRSAPGSSPIGKGLDALRLLRMK